MDTLSDHDRRGEERTEEPAWIELRDGKQWSRLLYTNPVCFLCTTGTPTTVIPTTATTTASADGSGQNNTSSNSTVSRNVMVISWLTATSNHGRFMLSINKHRFTASRLRESPDFLLCVPVKGMEELIRNVGSTSGCWGSKFPADHESDPDTKSSGSRQQPLPLMSKKKRKRDKVPRFPTGIPGLQAVSVGNQQHQSNSTGGLFAVQGTVAHLVCRIYRWVDDDDVDNPVIDTDHFLGLAEVTWAYVHPSYWNQKQNLFCPQTRQVSPYLTFFGAQKFGHVISANDEE